MSRELKFRIYVPQDKGFIYFGLQDYPQGIYGAVSEPMQFTGLKDKNDREIYEGDILKLSQKELKYQYLMDKPFPVIFDNYSFGLKVENLNELYEFLFLSQFNHSKSEIEIVGNIHETPNLLN